MQIREIQLIGFRNYLEAKLKFNQGKTIIIGKNAQGKSNLLEVIQILSHIKSRRASKDAELVNFALSEAVIKANGIKEDGDEIEASLLIRKSGRRSLKINGISHKPRELLHHFYSVSFMVDDLDIINGSPNTRREWLDSVIIQIDKNYANLLAKFGDVLEQRNSFFRELADKDIYHYSSLNSSQREQLSIWDEMFVRAANELSQSRADYIMRINPVAAKYYQEISQSPTQLSINYQGTRISSTDLEASRARDFARSFSNIGPHRDDVLIKLNDNVASSYASQGERRSIILAIKLAELDLLKKTNSDYPILLLDDVLAELDEDRQDFLLEAIPSEAQVIITTTHLGKHLEKWSSNAQIIEVEQGIIKEPTHV